MLKFEVLTDKDGPFSVFIKNKLIVDQVYAVAHTGAFVLVWRYLLNENDQKHPNPDNPKEAAKCCETYTISSVEIDK